MTSDDLDIPDDWKILIFKFEIKTTAKKLAYGTQLEFVEFVIKEGLNDIYIRVIEK